MSTWKERMKKMLQRGGRERSLRAEPSMQLVEEVALSVAFTASNFKNYFFTE